jgi:hypothetical protein
LHEQNRTLKNRINELELERIRMVDSEDKLIHQLQSWEEEHANSNTDLENLLHSLLDMYRENRLPSQSIGPSQQRRPGNPYSRNLEHQATTTTGTTRTTRTTITTCSTKNIT